jgi:putative glutamine amidotransferase
MNKTNKKIGIVGWKTGDNSIGVTLAYAKYLSNFGDVIILTPTSTFFDLDLLVLPGGSDLSSHFYGRLPYFGNSNPDLMKEYFYKTNLPMYIEKKVPIFGICLGMQMLNVAFGGSLTQHILGDEHPYYSQNSRDEIVHDLWFTEPFKYMERDKPKKVKKQEFTNGVNSIHHQGVCLADAGEGRFTSVNSDVAPELDVVAYYGQVVEILAHKTLPIAGVQFHPEELFYSQRNQEQTSKFIIENLLLNGSIPRQKPQRVQVAEM